jgi:hypothetical protein
MNKLLLILGALALAATVAIPIFTHMAARRQHTIRVDSETKELREIFSAWTAKHSKIYATPAEKEFRFKTFAKNLLKIKAHNSNTKATYTMAVNQFADLSNEEFISKLGVNNPELKKDASEPRELQAEPETVKASLAQTPNFDWRNYLQQQYITGSSGCNDNYAWVGAVVMNADYFIKYSGQPNQPFSPQTYIDCSGNFGNYGCNGGWAVNAFKYSQQWGEATMASYPYTGMQKACTSPVKQYMNSNINYIPQLSNTILYNTLANKNIISVNIDISGAQFYKGGVFTGPCTTTVNQGVVLVGAGLDGPSGLLYWTVLNTWGPNWGEGGYMRIARFTVDNNPQYSSCGLNMYASLPVF